MALGDSIDKVPTTADGDFISYQESDPVLAIKMHIVNEASDTPGSSVALHINRLIVYQPDWMDKLSLEDVLPQWLWVGSSPGCALATLMIAYRYAVDSMLAILMSIAAGQVSLEFQPSYARGGQISLYVGLLL